MKKPSYERYREDRGFKDPKELPKGPNGFVLCRYCSKEVHPPQRTFCSPECIHNFKIESQSGYMRKVVFERDRGVCKKCGLDTEKLRELLFRVKETKGDLVYLKLLETYQIHYNYNFALEKHFYEVDHILPVAHGGGASGLDNLQSLCVPCHKGKTHRQLTKSWKRNY